MRFFCQIYLQHFHGLSKHFCEIAVFLLQNNYITLTPTINHTTDAQPCFSVFNSKNLQWIKTPKKLCISPIFHCGPQRGKEDIPKVKMCTDQLPPPPHHTFSLPLQGKKKERKEKKKMLFYNQILPWTVIFFLGITYFWHGPIWYRYCNFCEIVLHKLVAVSQWNSA